MRIDPTGMLDWQPEVDVDGNTSYVAEKGDSPATMAEQYGISQQQAEQITGAQGSTPIAEGTRIDGCEVYEATGSNVLKLDLSSKGLNDADINRQVAFAINKENVNDQDFEGNLNDYFSNLKSTEQAGAGGSRMGVDTDPSRPTKVNLQGQEMNINVGISGSNDGRFSTSPNGSPSRILPNGAEAYDYLHPNAYPANPFIGNRGWKSTAVPVITIWRR